MSAIIQNRSKSSLIMQAIRPFSFTASVTTVLVAAVSAIALNAPHVDWFLLPIVLFGAVLFHTSSNLISEYHDYKYRVDRPDTFGSSRILVDNLMQPKQILLMGYLSLGLGLLLGSVLIYFRGLEILYYGIAGVIGAVFYTAKPFRFKYNALGDILVFLMFGPILILGSYLGLTGHVNTELIWISVPIALLVVGILHANNTRDIKHDTEAKVNTFASVIGLKNSLIEYKFLVYGAYISAILLAVFKILDWYVLTVILSFPGALKNIKEIQKADIDNPQEIAMLDVKTAQHHTQFGILYIIGIILSALL